MSVQLNGAGFRAGKVLRAILAQLLVIVLAAPAWSQAPAPPPPPVAPGTVPAWTVVPSSPKVLYAPNEPGDIFRLHRHYFYYYGGYWYRSKHLQGPWHPVRKLPKAIQRVPRSSFKSPPPW